jgi:hypothetical protein
MVDYATIHFSCILQKKTLIRLITFQEDQASQSLGSSMMQTMQHARLIKIPTGPNNIQQVASYRACPTRPRTHRKVKVNSPYSTQGNKNIKPVGLVLLLKF